MDRNKYSQFNPQVCERYLSAFGKQVLQALVQQWNNEREERASEISSQNRRTYCNKKVLNFNDESKQQPPPMQIYSTEEVNNLNLAPEITPKTITLSEIPVILNTQETAIDGNFLHPTIVSRNIITETFNSKFDDDIQKQQLNSAPDKLDKNPFVDWDNMFDTEIFHDLAVEHCRSIEENDHDDTPNILVPKNNISKTVEETINYDNEDNHNEKRKNKIMKCKAVKKRKHTQDVLENSPKPKKVNAGIQKCSFRKQKYTKTVKNWLNNVESYNNEESDIETICNPNNDNISSVIDENKSINNKITDECNTIQITLEKPIKAKKKVVQAQLTNKGGVMKYSKPKNDKEPSRVENNVIKMCKDKKEKANKKFIPPIRSQIPVKDITYEIFSINDNNAEDIFSKLNGNMINKLVAILIYSNGYCQLNSQYTEGTCTADSILLATGTDQCDIFYCFKGTGPNVKRVLCTLLENNTIISYEARHLLIYLTSYFNMNINTINIYDAKIGASLLDPDNPPENFNDLQKILSFTASYSIVTECALQKSAWYTSQLNACWNKLRVMLVENQLWQIFVEMEMKLLPIIADMELRGVTVDITKLKSMEVDLLNRMKLVEQECYKVAGKVFQINSALQVRSILYDELQLDTKCNVKIKETTPGGVKSTSEMMLRSLMCVHPLPKLILEYRRLHKGYSTFIAGISQHVNNGTVTPTWVQTAAATGRISSNNPNLQAIPKVPFNIVTFPDDDHTDSVQLKFRSVYVARAGYALLAADFQQVECRVFAHCAGDTALLSALTGAHDLFTVLAAQWLNKCVLYVSADDRERTKRLVYATMYGASATRVADILRVTHEQARRIDHTFSSTFPSLKSFGRHVVTKCSMSGGRLVTAHGRVRHIANIDSEDFSLRSHAERQAINFIIQGSAADLCKTAMILTDEELRGATPPVDARLLLQIHDELVWEVRDAHLDRAAGIIKRVMEGCGQHCGIPVPLPVTLTVGSNWGDMSPYNIETVTNI